MKKNITNILLLAVTGILLFSVLFIGLQLKNSGQSSITTVQKTKAATITYSKTYTLGGDSISLTPTPTERLLAMVNPTTSDTISPTASLSATPAETVTQALTETPTATASPTVISNLPVTSNFQNTAVIVGFGLFVIFFSFVL